MPRLKPKVKTAQSGREELIQQLADELLPDMHSPLLANVPEAEKQDLLDLAEERFYDQRAERLRPTMAERLETWPACAWGHVFCLLPELEDELTPEQRERWQTWLDEVKRERERPGRVVTMAPRAGVQ